MPKINMNALLSYIQLGEALSVQGVDGQGFHRLIKRATEVAALAEKPIDKIQPFTFNPSEDPLQEDRLRIEHLDLSVRAYNVLTKHGVEYIDQLVRLTRTQLLEARHMPPYAADEIEERLKSFGYSLSVSSD